MIAKIKFYVSDRNSFEKITEYVQDKKIEIQYPKHDVEKKDRKMDVPNIGNK